MVPLVRRRWRTSFDADTPPPSLGAVIRWCKGSPAATNLPARSDTPPPASLPKGVWQGGRRGRDSLVG